MDVREEYEMKIQELKSLDDYIAQLDTKLYYSKDEVKNLEITEVTVRKERQEKIKNVLKTIVGVIIGVLIGLLFIL